MWLRDQKQLSPMNIEILTGQILDKIPNITKWQRQFMQHLFKLLLVIRGRHNFENLSRYGHHNEATYRSWYARSFDFALFNSLLIDSLPQEERVIAFDPSYLPKSGKHTAGMGYFWSGCANSTQYGLELAGFASIGLQTQTALHICAKQTIHHENYDSLVKYYESLLPLYESELKQVSQVVVADAYFAKSSFVEAVVNQGFHLVSKLRSDCVLLTPYTGEKSKGRGRPKKYDGRVDLLNPDSKHFLVISKDDQHTLYEGIVYVKAFKRKVKCIILHTHNSKGNIKKDILFSTDIQMQGQKILQIYKLRFQIEFLYRDAKQFTGLTQCQARSENKIHTHINASLTAVSLAKVLHHLVKDQNEVKPFSMASIKSNYFNEHFLDLFFNSFGIPPEQHKNSSSYMKLFNYGAIAA